MLFRSRERLDALSVEQAALVDKVLKDMNNTELNTQLKELAEEKQSILDQLTAYGQDEKQQALRESRQRERDEWLEHQELRFTEYDDIITRRFVEKITVVDAETIRVKIQDADIEIEQTL